MTTKRGKSPETATSGSNHKAGSSATKATAAKSSRTKAAGTSDDKAASSAAKSASDSRLASKSEPTPQPGASKIPASGAKTPVSDASNASVSSKTEQTNQASQSSPQTGPLQTGSPKTGPVGPHDIDGARSVRTSRTSGPVRVAAWLVLFIVALGAVGTVTAPWWTERLGVTLPFVTSVSENDPLLAQLMGRMAELEKRASALEEQGSGNIPSPSVVREAVADDLAGVLARVDKLENALNQARTNFAESIKNNGGEAALALSNEATDRSLQELSERLANLETGGGQMETLLQRLDRLEARRQSADQTVSSRTSELSTALEDVNTRLRQLETARPPSTPSEMGARAVVLAVAQLRDSVRDGRPFQIDLDALKAISQRNEAIAGPLNTLQHHAKDGIPTLASLHTQFEALAAQIVTASGQATEEAGWMSRTADRLAGLVRVRRVGDVAPEGSVDRLVSDAEALLKVGDLKTALETLSSLPNQGADVLAAWSAQAQARLDAEQALASLHIHAVALLGPQTPSNDS